MELAGRHAVNLMLYPKQPPAEIQRHLPKNVEKSFCETISIPKISATSAAQTFRHTLEFALKALSDIFGIDVDGAPGRFDSHVGTIEISGEDAVLSVNIRVWAVGGLFGASEKWLIHGTS
ncbi:hypothetical protein [Burkholderia sp. TSV86]|uniref:hypothetical protein n=1 Tax=Burkholderia sp. TSV86 TaxID=1385594 RepID=UPI0012E37063|nr:hypothetical protein [Burkholderia sp. TSV86]